MIKCPLTSVCHNSLSKQLDKARDAHKETIRETGEIIRDKDSQISVMAFQLSLKTVGIEDLNAAARKKRSGYQSGSIRPSNPCGKCEHLVVNYNYDDRVRHQCHPFQHPVSESRGTCPNHSDLIALETLKTKVA